jgi:pantothenate kinase
MKKQPSLRWCYPLVLTSLILVALGVSAQASNARPKAVTSGGSTVSASSRPVIGTSGDPDVGQDTTLDLVALLHAIQNAATVLDPATGLPVCTLPLWTFLSAQLAP